MRGISSPWPCAVSVSVTIAIESQRVMPRLGPESAWRLETCVHIVRRVSGVRSHGVSLCCVCSMIKCPRNPPSYLYQLLFTKNIFKKEEMIQFYLKNSNFFQVIFFWIWRTMCRPQCPVTSRLSLTWASPLCQFRMCWSGKSLKIKYMWGERNAR